MFLRATPLSLLVAQVTRLQALLPLVADGAEEGVHDARVATRRIRELLPLTAAWHGRDRSAELGDRFKRIGQALGRVRDADVQTGLCQRLQERVPGAAPALVLVLQEKGRRRLALMRDLIKRFERLQIEELLESARSAGSASRVRPRLSSGSAWSAQARQMLLVRSSAAREAIAHATGVYLPNRAHKARIAIKKLRYAVEIAEATGLPVPANGIRDLRKSQEILGDLHDRQVLLDYLSDRLQRSEGDGAQLSLLIETLEAELNDLHRRYLPRRQRLVDICDAVRAAVTKRRVRAVSAVAAGAIVVSSTMYLLRRGRPA